MELRTFVNAATEIKYYKKTKTIVLSISEIGEDGLLFNTIEIQLHKAAARELVNRLNYLVTIISQ